MWKALLVYLSILQRVCFLISLISVLINLLIYFWGLFPLDIVMHFISLFIFYNFLMPPLLNFFYSLLFLLIIFSFRDRLWHFYRRSLIIISWFLPFLKILCWNILFVRNQNLSNFDNLVLSDSTIPNEENFCEHFLLHWVWLCNNFNCTFLSLIPIQFKLHSLLLKTPKNCFNLYLIKLI